MGVASACSFIRVQRRAAHPVLPASLFATRGFTAVLIAGFTYYFAAFAALPVISRWLQTTQAMRPLQAALVLTIQLVAFIAVSLVFSARLHDAPRSWVLGGGTVLTGLACLSGAVLEVRPDWTTLIVALAVTGIGAGIVSPVLPAVAATSVPAGADRDRRRGQRIPPARSHHRHRAVRRPQPDKPPGCQQLNRRRSRRPDHRRRRRSLRRSDQHRTAPP